MKNERNLGRIMASAWATYAREDALDYRVIEQSQDAFEFDVTGCRYAEFYKELGEPELGFLLVCSADFPVAEGLGPDIKLTARKPSCTAPLTVTFGTNAFQRPIGRLSDRDRRCSSWLSSAFGIRMPRRCTVAFAKK